MGDPLGIRGDTGKQFVDQIVDRDQLKIARGWLEPGRRSTASSQAWRGLRPGPRPTRFTRSTAGDRRQDVEDGAMGDEDPTITHCDLVEQDARCSKDPGQRLAVVCSEQADQILDSGPDV